MNKVKQISLACGLAAAAVLAGPAAHAFDDASPMARHAQWQGHHSHSGPSWLHGVQLSDTQKDQVFQLVYAQAPALHEKYKALRHIRSDLRKATMSDQYDSARVSKLASDEAQTRSSVTVIRAELRHKIYMLLTPEQKKQLMQQRHAPSNW